MAIIARPVRWLFLLLTGLIVVQAQNQPKVVKKDFGQLGVTKPLYFDNSDVTLAQTYNPQTGQPTGVLRSKNAGQEWEEELDVKGAVYISMHPFDNKVAFAFSSGRDYWVTHDQGESWKGHKLHAHLEIVPYLDRNVLSFHAGDSNKIIINLLKTKGHRYEEEAYYTDDGFRKGHLKLLRKDTRGCSWAQETPEFKPLEESQANRILCMAEGKSSVFSHDQRLLISDDFFKGSDRHIKEPTMSNGRTITGIVGVHHVKSYLIAAAGAINTNELAMFVSIDGVAWHRAEFGTEHKIQERSYTVLESTNYSLQVAVETASSLRSAILMSSNSNGTYFTQDIDGVKRNVFSSFIDFEKVMGFEGVILINHLKDDGGDIESLISFHDGKNGSWNPLIAGEKQLHLRSVTESRDPGRLYSSAAPGVLLGNGNTGDSLSLSDDEVNLFVSNDAGHQWNFALEGLHEYAFGDQGNILVAVPSGKLSSGGNYSVDHGKTWQGFEIDAESELEHFDIFSNPDSSSRTFLILAKPRERGLLGRVLYSVDFDDILPETCNKEDDFTEFKAIPDDQPCVMGHRQKYRRRKQSARCFIRPDSKIPQPELESCECTDDDFECDFNYIPKGGKCVPAALKRPDECEDPDGTFKDASGFRLIPGNDCIKTGDSDLEKDIARPCSDTMVPSDGKIKIVPNEFGGRSKVLDIQVVYLEPNKVSSDDRETVIVMTLHETGETTVYKSLDHGKHWEKILKTEEIIGIFRHEYNTDAVFFVTDTEKVFYSYDRGESHENFFKVEHHYNRRLQKSTPPFSFRPDSADDFIWTGAACKQQSDSCHLVSGYTGDRGDHWITIMRNSNKCEFIKRESWVNAENSTQLIYCGAHKDELSGHPLQLIRSKDFFQTKDIVFDEIVTFETTSEFVVSAGKDNEGLLFVNASVNGGDFAPAHFPPKFSTVHPTFTVLQSETHSITLFATVNSEKGRGYGRLLKSNSNGTFYVTSIENVNEDDDYFVDFKSITGLEGVSIANIVTNPDTDDKKRLQTRMTHNDGADWAAIDLPGEGKDSEGRNFDCFHQQDRCKLHLYGYTVERQAHASASGIGVLIGNGNVGEFLDESGNKDATFMSTDGGLKWREVRKGRHYWAFGDQGSIIVLVNQTKTNVLHYTENEKDWYSHTFTEEEVDIMELRTAPSDNSKMFLIFAKQDGNLKSFTVDFSDTRDSNCLLDKDDPDKSDYYTWSPKHPYQKEGDCLFGHVSVYHRKKQTSKCWNGPLIDAHGFHEISRNCSCIREDFECDFNYEKALNGECLLVKGFEKPDHSQVCRDNSSLIEYYEPTGYRRIPLDTCQGGGDLEYTQRSRRPCPGHEGEYGRMHKGISGFTFFLVAILLPLSVAGGFGFWAYQRWDGKFGAIRLGENQSEGVLDIDKPWIKVPIMVASAVIAVGLAVPGMIASIWRGAMSLLGRNDGRYTTRASFSRYRGEYAVVDNDEDELLGEEDDEET